MTLCLRSLRKTGRLLIAEDVCEAGCVGLRLMAAAEAAGIPLKGSALLNLGDGVVTHGKPEELLRLYGMDAEGLTAKALLLLDGGDGL